MKQKNVVFKKVTHVIKDNLMVNEFFFRIPMLGGANEQTFFIPIYSKFE